MFTTYGPYKVAPARELWIDELRRIAVLLVLVFHIIAVVKDATATTMPIATIVMDAIEPLRMPLLFVLSGMLVPRGLKKGSRRFLTGKLARILYPYVLWSLITTFAIYVLSQTIGFEPVPHVSDLLFAPVGHMWFLAVLFICYLTAWITRRVDPVVALLAAVVLGGYCNTIRRAYLATISMRFRLSILGYLSGSDATTSP